jgi:hypothetical protein
MGEHGEQGPGHVSLQLLVALLAVAAGPTAPRFVVAAGRIAFGQIGSHIIQSRQQLLFQFWRVVDLEGAAIVLDDAVGRLTPEALLYQQAIGSQLEEV